MPIDIYTGQITPEPFIVPEDQVDMQHRYAEELSAGESGYVDLHAVWVNPFNGELNIDGTFPIVSDSEQAEAQYNLSEMARIIVLVDNDTYHYVVDIAHIQEAARAAGEPLVCIKDVPITGLAEHQQRSVPGSALIQDSITLEMFAKLLAKVHGPDAVLAEITL
jgi:hypothetical protein